jgi:hypothetical protein
MHVWQLRRFSKWQRPPLFRIGGLSIRVAADLKDHTGELSAPLSIEAPDVQPELSNDMNRAD